MSEQKFGDLSKVNLYGADEGQLGELKQSQEDIIKSLENRYNQPNWFKVSAGFLKPQLGGFGASLGSASEALAENVEKQRESQIPIAQMRAQLAQTNLSLGSQQKANQMMQAWKSSGKPMDQATYAEVTALAPNSAAATAAKAAYEGGAKDIENTRAQQRTLLDAIQVKQAKGMPLSASETNFLQNFASGLLNAPESSRSSQIAQPKIDNMVDQRAQGDIAALQREIANTPKTETGRLSILNQELEKAKERSIGAVTKESTSLNPSESKTEGKPQTYYPPTYKFPDVSNMTDPERKSRELSYQRNVESAEKKSEDQVQQWRSVAADPVFSTINSEYTSAIDLLKTQPKTAKKVFNLLREDGSLKNQVLSAAQQGFGISLGSMAATLNLPVEAFQRAGLNEAEQLLADRLVRAMLVVGNAKLASQGITPEKGQDAYKQYLDNTKASLQQNPATALHNLQKDYVTFIHNKQLFDQVNKEYRSQQEHSPSPYTDVINNSPEIARINANAREEMHKHEADYQEAIRQIAKRRKAN
jgi:hypothetical protein